jgi:two-component system, OmpR family, sensor histidine kinase ChvG
MASDIATATDNVADQTLPIGADETAPLEREGPRRPSRLSPLTKRILAVNILALAILGAGLLELGDYQQGLVDTQLASLRTEAQVFAAAFGTGAISQTDSGTDHLSTAMARNMAERLVAPTKTRARVFDTEGRMIVDTNAIESSGGVKVTELPPPVEGGFLNRLATQLYGLVEIILPAGYPNEATLPLESPGNYPEVRLALYGDVADAVRRRPDNGLVLSVAVPIQHYREVEGALLLTSDGGTVARTVRSVRLTILEAFAIAFVITVLLSLYLAHTIARPLRRLANAAERVRLGHGRQVAIPAFAQRHDEIGELAHALHDMTGALWQRMDAIERFAADVAHELKNPLGSVRSAIETAIRIDDPEKRHKLLQLVLEDIERLTRLINDISEASRLDAELSRSAMGPVKVAPLLEALVEVHEATAADKNLPRLLLSRPAPRNTTGADLEVLGHEDRLVQVFRNIINNAISFSPPGGEIRISASRQSGKIVVTIDDQGPGIPEGKLEAIFERFYSERPSGEKFGTHSGLGLSISKQIIDSHRGTIRAENRYDRTGRLLGARFTIRLPAA